MPALRSGLVGASLLLVLLGVAQVESHGHGHHHHPGVELTRRDLGAVSRVASLADEAGPWNGFKLLLDAQLGDVRAGMAGLKSYLLQFGYISTTDAPPTGTNFTDTFDNVTQTAIMNYQRSFGLTVTGRLDVATLTQMIIPRCGRKDVFNGTLIMLQRGLSNATTNPNAGTQRWASFTGSPRWTRRNLTYAIDTTLLSPDVSQVDTEIAIDTAFAQWAAVTDLNFTRIQDVASADIKVSFDLLDHGDGNAFDGQLGVLAHAFAPVDGRLHFDNSESWSVNIKKPTSTLQDFDLVSVAVHEIGHIIGLEHSNVPDAIMYPSIAPLSSNQVLHADDIEGAQALYGVNPTYTPGSSTPGTVGNQSAAVASWRRLQAVDVALSCLGLLVAGFLSA